MQPATAPSPYPRQRPAPRASDRLCEDLVTDAIAALPADRVTRHDGWTPDRIRLVLDVLSQCGVVEDAAHACGMTRQGAYAFRNSARGRAFDVAWRAAQLLARNRIADDVMSRAIHGCREVIIRDGEVWSERHRFDNRLTMAVLKRLDELASPHVGQIDQAPCRVAHEFEALVDAVSTSVDDGMAFIQSSCALGYYDFDVPRILERNRDYAASCDATDAVADEWEPETSSTLDGEEPALIVAAPQNPPVRPELVEACPERLPQAGSRRGHSCSSAPSNEVEGFDKPSSDGLGADSASDEGNPPTNDELQPETSSTSVPHNAIQPEPAERAGPLPTPAARHPESSSTSPSVPLAARRPKHRSPPPASPATS